MKAFLVPGLTFPFHISCFRLNFRRCKMTKESPKRISFLPPHEQVKLRKEIRSFFYFYQWFCASEAVAIRLRSRTKIVKDAKALMRAARILEQWELPVRMRNGAFRDIYPHGFEVREVARTLEHLGTSRAHRPEGRQVKTYAKVLAEFFKLKAKRPLYGYIGRLLRAGFWDKWNPAGDLREAAKTLVKAPFSSD